MTVSGGFSDQFRHLLVPTEDDYKAALTTGLVVVDSNVLLSAYRFAPKAREELFSVLDSVSDRLWVPHQVGLEFHRNRPEVMLNNVAPYGEVLRSIREQSTLNTNSLSEQIMRLANRAALPEEQRERALSNLSNALEPLASLVEEYQAAHRLEEEGEDSVLTRFQALLSGRVGKPFDPKIQKDALAEAEKRNKEKIPPGYKDAPKYGDYFVWRQALDEAALRKPDFLTFVTSDTKEDWYHKVSGKNIGARTELTEEAFNASNSRLVMMSTESFLWRGSKYFDLTVSGDTLKQAKNLVIQDTNTDKSTSSTELLALLRRADEVLGRTTQGRSYDQIIEEVLNELLSDLGAIVVTDDAQFDFRIITGSEREAGVIVKSIARGQSLDLPTAQMVVYNLSEADSHVRTVCVTNAALSSAVIELNRRGNDVEFVSWRNSTDNAPLMRALIRALS